MEDHTGAPSHMVPVRRTDDTKELAFCHALPSTCWEEVIHDYQLGAILDVAVGDGSLALKTVRDRIAYTGLAFTDKHWDMVMARLVDLLHAGTLKVRGKRYDSNLTNTRVNASNHKRLIAR
ncbi:MAG: hypothetical protein ACKPKO_60635, partial [Candidatus Fonsibacter sp.]